MDEFDHTNLEAVVRVIQSSLTPAFLLTAVGSLLNVFTTRLARISDQVKALADCGDNDPLTRKRLAVLRLRSRLLDLAVVLAAFAGACVACVVLVLFVGLLRAKETVQPLFYLFTVAVCCTIGALCAFMIEVLLASRHIRAVVDREIQKSESLP